MKYVIKEVAGEGAPYVRVQDDDDTFDFTEFITDATIFISIEDVVAAITRRTDATSDYRYPARLTIVGVKEINQPRYEEVIL